VAITFQCLRVAPSALRVLLRKRFGCLAFLLCLALPLALFLLLLFQQLLSRLLLRFFLRCGGLVSRDFLHLLLHPLPLQSSSLRPCLLEGSLLLR
jgi:hypothetical protein